MTIANTMEMTMRIASPSLLVGTTLLLAACKEPETGFVFLENATDSALQVTVEFKGGAIASGPLKFQLEPGERDGWRFTSDKSASRKLDPSFYSMRITSEQYEREIERAALEKHIRKDGALVLRVDSSLFFCDLR